MTRYSRWLVQPGCRDVEVGPVVPEPRGDLDEVGERRVGLLEGLGRMVRPG